MNVHGALQPRSPEQVIATLAEYLHTDALCCRETDGPVADLQALVRCTSLLSPAVEAVALGHRHDCIPGPEMVNQKLQIHIQESSLRTGASQWMVHTSLTALAEQVVCLLPYPKCWDVILQTRL